MKQLIVRMDDDLHDQLKAFAAKEGRSMNELVVTALRQLANRPLTRRELRERLRAEGRLVEPAVPAVPPDPEKVRAATKGTGTSVSEALQWTRGEW